ncbi:hypothetical protein C8F01DRAFT_1242720 [Mycena amicta]|nr:hypothetical protein C8F01DRAFT_1242720 [Mycena amicta]
MDAFTYIVPTKSEEPTLPPINDDSSSGSSGSCVVCRTDDDLPPVDEDSSTGPSILHFNQTTNLHRTGIVLRVPGRQLILFNSTSFNDIPRV